MNERIIKFIDTLNISISEFERKCGLSNGAVSKMTDNTRITTIERISKTYPQLNIAWLRTGEGEMLKTSNTQSSTGDNSPNILGNGNSVNSTSTIDKALNEIAEQRKLVSKAQEQLSKSQEQIDKLLAVIDKMSNVLK